jgi:hypothetical protein
VSPGMWTPRSNLAASAADMVVSPAPGMPVTSQTSCVEWMGPVRSVDEHLG